MTNEAKESLSSYLDREFNVTALDDELSQICGIVEQGSYLRQLTELQDKIGYTPGPIHPVAMLGLIGEAGEVSECADFLGADKTPDSYILSWDKIRFQESAEAIDSLKKIIRSLDSIPLTVEVSDEFDGELADQFYYLKAVARARGLTIEDLARMSYEKVIARRGPVKEGDPAK